MEDEDVIYRSLQEHLDKMPVGFPPTESGVEIRILKYLFTPEEAKLTINLSTAFPEKLNVIYRRLKETGISKEKLEEDLDNLVKKGLIHGGDAVKIFGPSKSYSCAPFIIGFFEYHVNRLTKEFMQDYKEYLYGAYLNEYLNPDTPFQFRTIPIEKSVSATQYISNYDDVKLIVENAEGPFTVLNCICKQGKDLLGEPCKHTNLRETCIGLNEGALQALQVGYGKEITKKEAYSILQKAQDAGLVLTPANNQKPSFICTCCGDCCQVLTSLKKMPKPSEFIESNYYAILDVEICDNCDSCIDRCQMGAISKYNDALSINLDRCIGCGNCIPICPSGAIELVKKEKESIPPQDLVDLYVQILKSKS